MVAPWRGESRMMWSGSMYRGAGFVLGLFVVFSNCASNRVFTGRMLAEGRTATTGLFEGIVVPRADANFSGSVRFDHLSMSIYAEFKLKKGDNYIVMGMPPGRYIWSAVRDDKSARSARFGERYVFEVKAGV